MNKIEVLCVDETITLLVDGKLINYLFDPIEFVTPIEHEFCNQFFFTCTCDIAGCAGWHEGFNVIRKDGRVMWLRLDDHKDGIADTLVFDAEQYLEAQYECLGQLFAMADRRSRMTFVPSEDDWDDDRLFMGFMNVGELEATLIRAAEWAEENR